MRPAGLLITIAVVCLGSLALLVVVVWSQGCSRVKKRLREVAKEDGGPIPPPQPSRSRALAESPTVRKLLLPSNPAEQSRLRSRLLKAGLYHPQTLYVFTGVKVVLMLAPALAGLAAGLLHVVPVRNGLVLGMLGSSAGLVLPGLWLDRRKAARQGSLRRALPDALDVIVVCLEAGMGLQGALQRVVAELETIHTRLAFELNIILREVHLGHSIGEAMRRCADRTDLEEMRSLASVVLQSEHFGVSLARGLRVHAETLRVQRLHRAEEMGQRAAVKILFPTLLCIFPTIFLVLAGPAVMQMVGIFSQKR